MKARFLGIIIGAASWASPAQAACEDDSRCIDDARTGAAFPSEPLEVVLTLDDRPPSPLVCGFLPASLPAAASSPQAGWQWGGQNTAENRARQDWWLNVKYLGSEITVVFDPEVDQTLTRKVRLPGRSAEDDGTWNAWVIQCRSEPARRRLEAPVVFLQDGKPAAFEMAKADADMDISFEDQESHVLLYASQHATDAFPTGIRVAKTYPVRDATDRWLDLAADETVWMRGHRPTILPGAYKEPTFQADRNGATPLTLVSDRKDVSIAIRASLAGTVVKPSDVGTFDLEPLYAAKSGLTASKPQALGGRSLSAAAPDLLVDTLEILAEYAFKRARERVGDLIVEHGTHLVCNLLLVPQEWAEVLDRRVFLPKTCAAMGDVSLVSLAASADSLATALAHDIVTFAIDASVAMLTEAESAVRESLRENRIPDRAGLQDRRNYADAIEAMRRPYDPDGPSVAAVPTLLTATSSLMIKAPQMSPSGHQSFEALRKTLHGLAPVLADAALRRTSLSTRESQTLLLEMSRRRWSEELAYQEGTKTTVPETACAIDVAFATIAECQTRGGACDARVIVDVLSNVEEYFGAIPCAEALNNGRWSDLPGLVSRGLDLFQPRADVDARDHARESIQFVFDIQRFIAQDELRTDSVANAILDAVRQLAVGIVDDDIPAVIDAGVQILRRTLDSARSATAAEFTNRSPAWLALKSIEQIAPVVTALTSNARSLKKAAQDPSQTEALRKAREETLVSLVRASTRREGLDAADVFSIGAPVGLGVFGYCNTTGDDANAPRCGAKNVALQGRYGLSFPMGIAYQRLPRRAYFEQGRRIKKWRPGFHVQAAAADLGQFLQFNPNEPFVLACEDGDADCTNETDTTIAWSDFVTVGANIGVLFGTPQDTLLLAFDLRYLPAGSSRGDLQFGLTLSYYVPFLDFQLPRRRSIADR